MKTLKLNHELARLVLSGQKNSTWRIKDDKNIAVNDDLEFIDKVDPEKPDTWQKIGVARVDSVSEKRLGEVVSEDYQGHETYESKEEMIQTYRGYYGDDVNENTPVKIIRFSFKAYQEPRNVKESQ